MTPAMVVQTEFNRAIAPLYRAMSVRAARDAGAVDVSAEVFDHGREIAIAFAKGGKKHAFRTPVSPDALEKIWDTVEAFS